MNREILFRGKRIDNSEWIEGFYFELCHDGINTPCIGFEPLSANDYGEIYDSCYETVNPSTVGQYTDLTDKNGVRIFEGDVLRLYTELENYTWTAVVEFGNPNCTYNWGWHLKPLVPCRQNPDILLWVDTDLENIEAEIISNIHDGKDGQNDEL